MKTSGLPDAAARFRTPQAVVDDGSMSRDEKITLLRQWDYDLRSEQVADEENMAGDDAAEQLRLVREALRLLGADEDSAAAPTRHGT